MHKQIKDIFLKILIVVFSFMFVYCSIDTGFTDPTIMALADNLIFHQIFPSFFTFFEIILFMILLLSITKKRMNFNKSRTNNLIFIAYVIYFFLNVVNPNANPSNPIFGMALFSDISEYLIILLMGWCFFHSKTFIKNISFIYFIIFIFLIIRFIPLLIMWFKGHSNLLYFDSLNPELDTMIILALYQILFLTFFIIYRKKRFLFFSIFFLFILILSYRRSGILLSLSSSLILIVLLYIRHKKVPSKILIIFSLFTLFFVVMNLDRINIPFKYKKYIYRSLSAIPGLSFSIKSGEFSDTGHWEQTFLTTMSAYQKLNFWGTAHSNIFIKGQSSTIHNAYAYLAVTEGIFSILFYLMIFILLLLKFLKLAFFAKLYSSNEIVELALSLFLIFYMITVMVNPVHFLIRVKMKFLWITILAIIFMRKNENINYLDYKI